MLDYVNDWAQLALRWMHVLFAIAWIGHAFLFHSLEHGLAKPEVDDVDDDVEGELWMVHGGGFFRLQKTYKLPKVFTGNLHWFKYEALGTWVSGFLLLVVLYYFTGGVLMLDARVADLSFPVSVAIGLGSLVVGWGLYDTLWSFLGDKQPKLATVLTVALIAGTGIALTQLLSGRAAFLHTGAMLGTLMTANVWMRIIPGSKRMVAALEAGRAHDPRDGAIGHQRSVHNGYMHFPIVFLMISNHYPATYGHEYNWVMLLCFMAGGAAVRQLFYDGMAASIGVKGIVAGAIAGVVALTAPWPEDDVPLPEPSADGRPIDAATTGVITGTVRFTGTVPPAKELNLYGGCEQGKDGPTLEQPVKVDNELLRDAFVVITSGTEGWQVPPAPTEAVEVDQRGCVYEPRIHGARVGQDVVFINSDPMFHNVRTVSEANKGFNINMPAKDQRETKVFRRAERMVEARCDVHPWMISHIGVVAHPWFAISDATGAFRIEGVPPGDYTITAWHEVLGEMTAKATVSAKGRATADLTFTAVP